MSKENRPSAKRCGMMVIGILFLGVSVSAYRLSSFGTDAYSCMNLGISGFLHISFGTWQLIANAAILVLMFFRVRQLIGLGTFINMVCVGYLADLFCWLMLDVLQIQMGLPLRACALVFASIFAGLGVALYMTAGLGVAPYESVAIMLQGASGNRIPFQWARVLGDVCAVLAGVLFCVLGGNDLWQIVGIGTACNALFNGPLIQFFKTHLAEPMLKNS